MEEEVEEAQMELQDIEGLTAEMRHATHQAQMVETVNNYKSYT
jgi:hypothetical protein